MRIIAPSLLGALILTVVGTPIALGQNQFPVVDADQCVDAMSKEIEREHRIFRTVLFGSKKAEDSPIGTVVYEMDGSAWQKVTEEEWESPNKGFENVTHYNALIDQRSEVTIALGKPERKGIFETKGMTTSELIPYIGSSFRAFQCRLYQFCDAANASKDIAGDDAVMVTAKHPGCVDFERPSLPACHINNRRPVSDDILIFSNCKAAEKQLLDQEKEIIDAIVQYDAAHRTLQQLAGSLDLFLQEFNWTLTTTLQQATDLASFLGRIPCYLASCEAFPPLENEE